MVHGAAGFLDGHPPGLDLVFGGAAQGQAGGEQPGGRERAGEVAAVLAALDDLEQPVQDRAVPVDARPAFCRRASQVATLNLLASWKVKEPG